MTSASSLKKSFPAVCPHPGLVYRIVIPLFRSMSESRLQEMLKEWFQEPLCSCSTTTPLFLLALLVSPLCSPLLRRRCTEIRRVHCRTKPWPLKAHMAASIHFCLSNPEIYHFYQLFILSLLSNHNMALESAEGGSMFASSLLKSSNSRIEFTAEPRHGP